MSISKHSLNNIALVRNKIGSNLGVFHLQEVTQVLKIHESDLYRLCSYALQLITMCLPCTTFVVKQYSIGLQFIFFREVYLLLIC
jgi:hypothetical protein